MADANAPGGRGDTAGGIGTGGGGIGAGGGTQGGDASRNRLFAQISQLSPADQRALFATLQMVNSQTGQTVPITSMAEYQNAVGRGGEWQVQYKDATGQQVATSILSGGSSGSTSSGTTAGNENQIAAEQFWADQMEAIGPVMEQLSGIAEQQQGWATEDRARWEEVFKPVEDAFVADALTYGTVGRQELEAGRAASAVNTAFQSAMQAEQQRLEGYGISPDQIGRTVGIRAQQAAAMADAANRGRIETEKEGNRRLAGAVNLGVDTANRARGELTDAAGTFGTLANVHQNNTKLGLAATELGFTQDLQTQQQAFNEWSRRQEVDALYGDNNPWLAGGLAIAPNVADAIKNRTKKPASSTSNPSTGSGVFGPSQQQQDNPSGFAQYAATGGPIQAIGANGQLQALPGYDGNGTVEGVGGPTDDLVPAKISTGGTAMLSPGEEVVPADVAGWKGREFFVKLREKAKQDIAEEAQNNPPQYAQAIPMAPPVPQALQVA